MEGTSRCHPDWPTRVISSHVANEQYWLFASASEYVPRKYNGCTAINERRDDPGYTPEPVGLDGEIHDS